MMRLSDKKFRRLHAQRINSPEWKTFRRACLEKSGFRCCVCGQNYLKNWSKWQLQADHKRYWKDDRLIFGHETFDDVRVCCPDHHGKGVRSDDSMRAWRSSYRWLRVLSWVVFLPFWILRWLWRVATSVPKID